MERRNVLQFALSLLGAASARSAFTPSAHRSPKPSFIGAWHMESKDAPILHHGFVFHADGTLCSMQADGAYPSDSESDGVGAWEWIKKGQARGAFLEFRHDRDTHEYLGYVRVEFVASLDSAQTFHGQAHAQIFDVNGNLLAELFPTWSAQRIIP